MSEMFHSLILIISQKHTKMILIKILFFCLRQERLSLIFMTKKLSRFTIRRWFTNATKSDRKNLKITLTSAFSYTHILKTILWLLHGCPEGRGQGGALAPPGRSKLYCNAFSLWTLELDVLRETSQYRTCLPPGLLSADAHGLLIP